MHSKLLLEREYTHFYVLLRLFSKCVVLWMCGFYKCIKLDPSFLLLHVISFYCERSLHSFLQYIRQSNFVFRIFAAVSINFSVSISTLFDLVDSTQRTRKRQINVVYPMALPNLLFFLVLIVCG